MKVSVLNEREPSTKRKLSELATAGVGKLVRVLSGREPEVQYEPATDNAVTLGHYIAANLDTTRLRLIQSRTSGTRESASNYSVGEIREYLHSERYAEPVLARPQPHATLALYGKNYHSYPAGADNFMCQFGIFNLDDGRRLVQAVPYEWEGPSYGYEYDGMRSALKELFGEDSSVRELEKLARINLGIIQADGTFNPLRPFNPTAFGANLVPILERISSPSEENGLNIQLLDGRIEQF